MGPSAAARSASCFLLTSQLGRGYAARPRVARVPLDRDADGPDEAQELPADRGHDLLLGLAPGEKPS